MKEDKFDNVFMLVVKPNSTWEEETEDGFISLLPLSESFGNAVIMDLDEEHLVEELTQFKVYNVPARFPKFKVKNGGSEQKAYIIFRKERSVGRPPKEFS